MAGSAPAWVFPSEEDFGGEKESGTWAYLLGGFTSLVILKVDISNESIHPFIARGIARPRCDANMSMSATSSDVGAICRRRPHRLASALYADVGHTGRAVGGVCDGMSLSLTGRHRVRTCDLSTREVVGAMVVAGSRTAEPTFGRTSWPVHRWPGQSRAP